MLVLALTSARSRYTLMYMVTISMADARANLREMLDQVKTTHERYTITRHGEPDAVLMAVDDLEALEETLEILSDPETVAAIRRGLDELNAGERYTLEEVREELGL